MAIVVGKQPTRSRGPASRILVCAPSNAAIDELAQRIKGRCKISHQGGRALNVVRIGTEQAMSNGVKDISLDHIVDQRLEGGLNTNPDIGSEIQELRMQLEQLKQSRREKIAQLNDASPALSATLGSQIQVLSDRRQTLTTKLDELKDKQKADGRTLDTLRRKTQREVLLNADIICSTLSGSGHEILENLEFDMIIIDEAAQAIELSSLIPLKYGCCKCVMVGDPQQLPPTVISQEVCTAFVQLYLFHRLTGLKVWLHSIPLCAASKEPQRCSPVTKVFQGITVVFIKTHLAVSIQYRMHPDISRLPSRIFYDNRLLNGPDMLTKTKQPWHEYERFGTYKFINVSWGSEESRFHSLWNASECDVALDLYTCLISEFPGAQSVRVGVVSMYKAQVSEIRRRFMNLFGDQILQHVDFNTVDGFQGQEKDVIILSCVRSGPGLQTIGFLSGISYSNDQHPCLSTAL